MTRKLKILIALAGFCFVAACGGPGPVDEPVTPTESAVWTGTKVGFGSRQCYNGPLVTYQPIIAQTYTRASLGLPSRLAVTLNASLDATVLSAPVETMSCSGALVLYWNACAAYPNTFCNSTGWTGCAIYRKDPGTSTWRWSRSGWIDVQNATTDANASDYPFKFTASGWDARDGSFGCGYTSPTTTYFEFH